MLRQKSLLPQAVLRRVEYAAFGANRCDVRCGVDAGGRYVLELQGDDVHVCREALHGLHVVIGGHDFTVGNVTGGRVGFGREGVDSVAHAPGGDGDHATELTAAEDADGRAWKDWVVHVAEPSVTVWSFIALATASSCVPLTSVRPP